MIDFASRKGFVPGSKTIFFGCMGLWMITRQQQAWDCVGMTEGGWGDASKI